MRWNELIARRLLGLPKPLSKAHLERLARDRSRAGEVIINEATYGETIVGGSGGMDGLDIKP